MEKYLILLSPLLSQDLFGNNTISPPWQLFATSPVCFWHRHLHPPEKLHHKLYTLTFWSFFAKHVLCYYEYLHPPEKLYHKLYTFTFWAFFFKTCSLFLQIFTLAWEIAPQTLHLHLFAVLFGKTCSLFFLQRFTLAWFTFRYMCNLWSCGFFLCKSLTYLRLKCFEMFMKLSWCVLTRLAQNIFPLGTEQLIFKQGQHRVIPKQTDIPY